MKFFLSIIFGIFFITYSYGTNYAVVDDGSDGSCSGAWPSAILGNYIESGTLNSKPYYQGPSGYYLYYVYMPVVASNCWIVGYPLGSNDINGDNIRFYITSSAATPPTGVRYTATHNGCGYMKVTLGTASGPSPSTLMTPSNVTINSMELYWSQASSTTGYHVYVSTNSTFTAMVSGMNPLDVPQISGQPYPPTTTTLTGLAAGTTYYIVVRGYNGAGESTNSNMVSATTIPGNPTAIAASEVSDLSFKANWNVTSGATGYLLYVSPNSGFSSYVSGYNGVSTDEIFFTVTGLTANTAYYYRIKAYNSSGNSGNSNTISLTTASAAPVATAATSISTNSFTANWNTSTAATAYYLDVSLSNTFSTKISGYDNKSVGNVTSISVAGLVPGTTYYYRVRSGNTNGTSSSSNTITQTTVPGTVTATAATNILESSFSANWTSVSGSTGYYLDVATDAGFSTIVSGYNNLDVGNVQTYQVNSNLTPNTIYYYRVRAYNTAGVGSNSNTINLTTEYSVPTIQASLITFSDITENGMNVSWTNGNGGNRVVFLCEGTASSTVPTNGISYTASNDWNSKGTQLASSGYYCVFNSNSNSVSLTNLRPGTSYTIRIFEYNDTGTKSKYLTSTATDNPNSRSTVSVPPTLITLDVTLSNETSATLGGNITSNGGDPIVEKGVVYSTTNSSPIIGGAGVTHDINGGTETSSFTESINALSIATHYYYQAYATNSKGISYGGIKEFITKNTISSIIRSSANPTKSNSVSWSVNFAAPVTGLNSSNFSLVNTGLSGSPEITGVSGSGTSWTITASTGGGTGTLGLNLSNETGLNAGFSNTLPFNGDVFEIDRTVPTLSSTDPLDNSRTVYLGSNVVLGFNDNMIAGTGNITIRKSDGTIFEQIPANDSKVTISGSQVTINPSGLFSRGTNYYIEIDATALADDAGNSFAGISDNSTFNFKTVDVLINEAVTEPRQDWSSNGFNGIAGSGAIDDNDEWIELYIKTPGIDFNSWTIELIDGSDIVGNLGTSGAFQTSKYFGTGSYTNTISGDFLVLGGVNGGGSMDNNITINLKDPTGAIVDAVTFGSSPSSVSSNKYNESAQRLPNGTDSDRAGDWTQGQASLGGINTGPSVALSVSSGSINENDQSGSISITATLSSPSSMATTVNLAFSGTATSGSDYTITSTSITIPANSTSATTTLNPVDDTDYEGNESVNIDILSVTNGTEAGTQTQTIYILENDSQPTVSLSSSGSLFDENGGVVNVIATLSNKSYQAVTVNLDFTGTATNISDYTRSNPSITINAGSLSGSVTLTGQDDSSIEGNETVVIDISSIANGSENGAQQQTITITDDDTAELSISVLTNAAENATNGRFVVSSTKQFDKPVVVTFTSSGTATSGIDYSSLGTSFVFPAYKNETNLDVNIIADDLVEDNETINVTLTASSNAYVSIVSGSGSSATMTVVDDDTAELSITATTQAMEDNSDGIFTITTTKQFDKPVTVTYTTTGTATAGSDYNSLGSTFVFPAYTNEATLTVDVKADNLVESDESVVVSMTGTSDSDVTITSSATSSATIVITDNDAATLHVEKNTDAYENISDGAFDIITDKTFDKDVNVAVSVKGTAIAGSDYSAIAASHLFPAFTTKLTIPVTQLDDSESEANESVVLSLVSTDYSKVTTATVTYATATVTIFDDDLPLVTLSQSTNEFSENSGQNIITAILNKTHSNDVTVNLGVSGSAIRNSDYTIPSSITIKAGELTGTVVLSALQDQLVESDETVIIEITSVINGVESGIQKVSSLLTDDDIATLSVSTTAQAAEDITNGEFTISTDKQFDSPVLVTFTIGGTATEGTDYININNSITFPSYSNTITVPVQLVSDTEFERDETVILSLERTNNAGVLISSTSSASTVVIADNDKRQLIINDPELIASKIYDGNTTARVTAGKLINIDGNDDVNVSASGTYDNPNVGAGKTITIRYSISGSKSQRYIAPVDLIYTKGEITPKQLNISSPAIAAKVYDGTTDANMVTTIGKIEGVVNSDNVSVLLNSAKYDTKNAGMGKTVTVSYSLNGLASFNYMAPVNSVVKTGEISPKQLIITDPTSLTTKKVYDGNTLTTATAGTFTNLVLGDVVSSLATANFDNPKVGPGKTITVVFNINGPDAANYIQPVNYTVNSGEITPKQLSATIPDVTKNKMYDGNTTAVINNIGSLIGVAGNDNVILNGLANYNNAIVGTGKTITLVYTINGTDAGNYLPPANYVINGAKISEEVKLSNNLVVPVEGTCQNDNMALSYTLASGTPTEYQITFDAAAKAAGFKDINYSSLPSSGVADAIFIPIPETIAGGTYKAQLKFRNELLKESPAYDFSFTVNLSKTYLVTKFNDVILCDNSSNRFSSYQWYKNGVAINGATGQFYNDLNGLNGTYHVRVTTKSGETMRTCELTVNGSTIKRAQIDTYPNPGNRNSFISVKISGIDDEDLHEATMYIYHVNGMLIKTIKELTYVNKLQLPAGEYIGVIRRKDGTQFTYKIIVI